MLTGANAIRGHVVQVVQVVRRQVGPGQEFGEQVGVHLLRATGPELVELDGDQRGLGAAGQPGNHPGIRVGLLEVVDRAVHEELPHLPPLALVLQEMAQTLTGYRFHQQAVQHVVQAATLDSGPPVRRRRASPAPLGWPAARVPTPIPGRRPGNRGSAARSRRAARVGGPRPADRRRRSRSGRARVPGAADNASSTVAEIGPRAARAAQRTARWRCGRSRRTR